MRSHRRIGRLTALIAPVVVAASLTLTVVTPPSAEARPVAPRLSVVELDGLPSRAAASAAVPAPHDRNHRGHVVAAGTDQVRTKPFRLVALTWSEQAPPDLVAWVRHRAEGRWSQWYELPMADDHGPDPGSLEDAGQRQREGTEPLVVPESDGVQVRVDSADGSAPADLRVDLIDPGTSAADAGVGTTVPGAASAAAARPQINSRADWGADESIRTGGAEYGTIGAGFVHHTVNSNSYTAAEVPAIIRSIYAYHVKSRGWKDIGYNFLVDRFGRIWEGRFGGVDRPVIGAHTAGYNDDAFAMSAIGTYTDVEPSAATLDAYGRLFAWKLGLHGVDPTSTVSLDGVRFQAVSGHRDAAATECPGSRLYAKLGSIRTAARSYQQGGGRNADTPSFDGDAIADVVAREAGTGNAWLYPGSGNGGWKERRRLSAGWTGVDLAVASPDFDGDGKRDVLARERATGALVLHPGDGAGGWLASRQVGSGWQGMAAVVAPGDVNGDGRNDVLAVERATGALWLYPGDGRGGWLAASRVGSGWQVITDVVGVRDWDGDSRPDLMARRGDGSLWLYPSNGTGGWNATRQIGSGWQIIDALVAPGDFNGDGQNDVLARERATGDLWLYPGDGRGGWLARARVGTGWQVMDLIR